LFGCFFSHHFLCNRKHTGDTQDGYEKLAKESGLNAPRHSSRLLAFARHGLPERNQNSHRNLAISTLIEAGVDITL
jgi:hypothetical protein